MKLWIIILIIIGVVSGISIGITAKAALRISPPKELVIPSLNIDANIEQVTLDKNGAIDVPKNVWDVAWYKNGPRPGEKGKAIIDGHLDSLTGPAVFYKLSNMEKNDRVLIKDTTGKIHTFLVTEKHIYKYNALPADVIYGSTDSSELQLITCAGDFDHVHHNYLDRIVITAVTN